MAGAPSLSLLIVNQLIILVALLIKEGFEKVAWMQTRVANTSVSFQTWDPKPHRQCGNSDPNVGSMAYTIHFYLRDSAL